jgi:hypothetical protein
MILDGSFDDLFWQYHGDSIQKACLLNRKIFKVPNPFLSTQKPFDQKEFWLDPRKTPRGLDSPQVSACDGLGQAGKSVEKRLPAKLQAASFLFQQMGDDYYTVSPFSAVAALKETLSAILSSMASWLSFTISNPKISTNTFPILSVRVRS